MTIITLHQPSDPTASEAGAAAFASMVTAFKEVGCYMPEKLNPALFSDMWTHGSLMIIGARNENRMVGCRVVVLAPSLFNPELLMATTASLFVAPDFRRKGVGRMLLEMGDAAIKQRNAVVSVVPWTPEVGNMTESQSYLPTYSLAERTL